MCAEWLFKTLFLPVIHPQASVTAALPNLVMEGELLIHCVSSVVFIPVVFHDFQIRMEVFSHMISWYCYLSIKDNRDKFLTLKYANFEHPI